MRCYFHLIGSVGELPDEEGVEVNSVEEARTEALKAIVDLRREDAGIQADWNGWKLIIVGEAGEVLSTVRLNVIDYPVGGWREAVSDTAHNDADAQRLQSKKAVPHVISGTTFLSIHWMRLAADVMEVCT